MYMTRALPEVLECMSPTVNKGTVIAPICALYGTTHSRALAFGDGENDAPMFRTLDEAGGHAVAMANAMEALLGVARHRTLSNDEGGVGAFLERVFGL
jgi:hydroxymethylpyrimidine pyrophosphatase-like HAD family hydrolase